MQTKAANLAQTNSSARDQNNGATNQQRRAMAGNLLGLLAGEELPPDLVYPQHS